MRSDVAEKGRFVCLNVTVQKSLNITLAYITLAQDTLLYVLGVFVYNSPDFQTEESLFFLD